MCNALQCMYASHSRKDYFVGQKVSWFSRLIFRMSIELFRRRVERNVLVWFWGFQWLLFNICQDLLIEILIFSIFHRQKLHAHHYSFNKSSSDHHLQQSHQSHCGWTERTSLKNSWVHFFLLLEFIQLV